jgi:hypothetical protein
MRGYGVGMSSPFIPGPPGKIPGVNPREVTDEELHHRGERGQHQREIAEKNPRWWKRLLRRSRD